MDEITTKLTDADHGDGTTALFTPEKQDEVLRKIYDLFLKSGKTVSQLAREIGVSERTLMRFFSGKTKDPHFFTTVTIIKVLGGDVREIVGIDPLPKSESAPADNPYGALLLSYQQEAQTLRGALDTLTTNLDALTDRLASAHKYIRIRTIALIAVIAVFVALEIIDLCNPAWGRYQWAVELFGNFLRGM